MASESKKRYSESVNALYAIIDSIDDESKHEGALVIAESGMKPISEGIENNSDIKGTASDMIYDSATAGVEVIIAQVNAFIGTKTK